MCAFAIIALEYIPKCGSITVRFVQKPLCPVYTNCKSDPLTSDLLWYRIMGSCPKSHH